MYIYVYLTGLPLSLCIHFLGKFDSNFCKECELIRIYLLQYFKLCKLYLALSAVVVIIPNLLILIKTVSDIWMLKEKSCNFRRKLRPQLCA